MRGKPLVLLVAGTRPEAIKLAPVIWGLRARRGLRHRLIASGQHKELLSSMLGPLGLKAAADLAVMSAGQTPARVRARVAAKLGPLLARARPDLVVVQGDTTSALAAAQAAARRGIPVAHVEAGLRSHDLRRPWPEEGNRVAIDRASTLLFAPTRRARANLVAEGLGGRLISVTGNTAVDALLWAMRRRTRPAVPGLPRAARYVALTLHRRESFGPPLERLLRGVLAAAERCPGLHWVFPVHPNPRVGDAARRLLRHPRIHLVAPLGYLDFVGLMAGAEFLVTDSGGIQEEAPTLRKAVLVLRDKTERPELIGKGGVLAGTGGTNLPALVARWAAGRRPRPPRRNPFGDGKAGERIARAIEAWLLRRRAPGGPGYP